MQTILAKTRAAVDHYQMIRPGDAVAVGVSGGKDSMLLLAAMDALRRFYPAPFTVTAITVDPRFNGADGDYAAVAAFCAERGIPYVVQPAAIWETVFLQRQETNPCSLCAKMRRGVLHRVAVEHGCRVVALGHQEDDAAETFMMNLLDGGTLSCFSPVTELDRRGIRLIRPLVFLTEKEVAAAARRLTLPIVRSACPMDGATNRQAVKERLAALDAAYPDINHRIVSAMQKAHLSGW